MLFEPFSEYYSGNDKKRYLLYKILEFNYG